ncbi:MAG: hypothetical protein DVB28_001380 [Verrucomicrobia bacterium]|nr:MAG: hypothetical protein DVB28_001380 [Verrucomicrobiota bacterium]
MTNYRSKSTLAFAAMVALPVLAWAGTAEKAMAAEPASKPSITGNLSLNVDSHFVSFGADVWGPNHQLLLHPSLELSKAITNDFKLILGTWWDVNDRPSVQAGDSSHIGHRIQEVDVWFGGAYTTGPVTTTVLYQQWMYAGANEQAVELKFSVDTFLKPSLLIHQRLGTGAYGADTVAVLGASYDFKAGPVSFSIPASVSVESGGYHTGKDANGKLVTGKAGFGFGSLGLSASVPTDFISKDASFSVGVTGYATDKVVIPCNSKQKFLNLTAGVSIPF